MPLPQLQQYAALHKNDPYVVSLALSIANQKKQMLAGKAGQAGMQPQPKVVDQALAQMMAPPPQQMATAPQQQMLPEDTGIGQLPAQNMQNLAEGGIVAFEDGGSVPGYADGAFTGTLGGVPPGAIVMGNMYQDPVTGKMIPIPQRDALPFGNVPMNYAENKRIYEAKKQEDIAKRTEAAKAIINESPEDYAFRKVAELEAQGGKKLSPDARNMAMSQFVKDKIAGQVSRGEASFTKSSALPKPATTYTGDKPLPGMTPPGQSPLNALPKPVAAAKPAAPAAPAAPVPAPVDPMAGIKALDTKPMTAAEAKEQAAALSDSTELRKQLEANEKFTTDAYAKLLGDYDKKIAAMPEAYKGYEARLQKEEAEAASDKDKALGMAIFQAGLGMLSGTSQYAFENIGKGALAGLENYQSALKDLKKAQRERDKAFADIEAARLAEKRGDIKAHTELQARGIEALSTAKNRTVEATSKIFDVDTRTATGIFETRFRENLANERTMYTSAVDIGKQRMADDAARQRDIANNAAALQRAQIQANAPGAEERILSNPALFSKKMDLLTAATGMRGDDALVASYIRNPTALAALEVTDPQLAAQIKQKIKMQMISPINLPADAPVRP
jgi:hypothetical protein